MLPAASFIEFRTHIRSFIRIPLPALALIALTSVQAQAIDFLGLQDCNSIVNIRLDWSSDLGPPYIANFPDPASCATFASVNQPLMLSRSLAPGYGCAAAANLEIVPAGTYAGTPIITFAYDHFADHTTNNGYGFASTGLGRIDPQFSGVSGSTPIYWQIDIEVLSHDPLVPLRILQDNHGYIFTAAGPGSFSLTGVSPYSDIFYRVEPRAARNSGVSGSSHSRGSVTFSFDTAPLSSVDDSNGGGRFPVELKASPNPTGGPVLLSFDAPRSSEESLNVYNALGQRVRQLQNAIPGDGIQSVLWDGRDDQGLPVPNGVYFAQLTGAGRAAVARISMRR